MEHWLRIRHRPLQPDVASTPGGAEVVVVANVSHPVDIDFWGIW